MIGFAAALYLGVGRRGDAAPARTTSMICRDRTHEHLEHLGHQRRIAEQADAQPPWERERPLTVVDVVGQDMIDQCAAPSAIRRPSHDEHSPRICGVSWRVWSIRAE